MSKIQTLPRRRRVAAACCLLLSPLPAAPAASVEPTATAEVVVTAQRLSGTAAQPSTLETVTAAQIEEGINTVTAAGVLQYLPSVHVRERYVGDRNAVLVMRVNSSIASAQTTVYGDGLLLSNFLNNSFSTAPRWGMVSPDEIERVEVMYGPFSALYPGNSAGGVVQLITRQPQRFEAHVAVDGFTERFQHYGTDARFSGGHASAALGNVVGNTVGDLSYSLALDHLDSQSHPQTFGAATLKTGAAAAAGSFTPVNSAQVYRDIDTAGKPRIIVSATGIDHTVQDMAKLKLAYHFSPTLSARYTLGLWQNTANGTVASYLRDASGNTVYNAGTSLASPLKYVRIDGLDYSVAAATPSRAQSEHWMHGLSLKASTGTVDWDLVGSVYDQKKDISRTATPSNGLDSGLAAVRPGGQVTFADGTGWHNLDLRGQWRSAVRDAAAGQVGDLSKNHTLSFGLHHDRYQLASVTYGTAAAPVADWLSSDTGALSTSSYGKTRTDALYLQDVWRPAADWTVIAGGRQERWTAFDGSNFNASNAAPNPKTGVYADRSQSNFSPKLSLAWQARADLSLRASLGKGVRYPTVAEIFQTFNGPNNIKTNDPGLLPEQVNSSEWVAQQQFAAGLLRASLFTEDKRDALISQTDVTVTPNIASIQNVDRVQTRGLELAGRWAGDALGLHRLELNGSATTTHSVITRDRRNPGLEGTAQPRIPDLRATVAATWHASDALSASVAYRYSGRQHNALFNTATGQYTDPNPNVYGAVSHYSVFDAKLLYHFDRSWSGSLGVNNLGNFKYYVNPNPYPQRTFFAGLKYDL